MQTLGQSCNGPSLGATGQFDDPNADEPFQAPTWAAPRPARCASPIHGGGRAPEIADQAGQQRSTRSAAVAHAPPRRPRPGRHGDLPPPRRRGHRLHADGLTHDRRRHQQRERHVAARRPAAGRGAGGLDETLVARGLYRPEVNSGSTRTSSVPAPPKRMEVRGRASRSRKLPPSCSADGRDSNGQGTVTVSNVELRLPVLEQPGSPRRPRPGSRGEGRPARIPARQRLRPGYARPKSASPMTVSLVPAFAQCTAPDRTHGPPLAFPSCSSPEQTSPNLTVSTRRERSGSQLVRVRAARRAGRQPREPADEADVKIDASLADVRQAAGLADYTGELSAQTTLRITDRASGDGEAATVVDIPLPVTVPCTATPKPGAARASARPRPPWTRSCRAP